MNTEGKVKDGSRCLHGLKDDFKMSVAQYEECRNYMVHGKPHYEGQLTLDCRAKKVANKDENEGKAGPLRKAHSSYHISQDQRNK